MNLDDTNCESPERCPLRELLTRLGDKWSLLTIMALAKAGEKPCRFSELMRNINGISQRMLTTTLRHLERDGVITRWRHIAPRLCRSATTRGICADGTWAQLADPRQSLSYMG